MDRQAYAKWIREVRGKISQKDFGEKICRFKNEGENKVCRGYHRNEISNWEKEKNLPTNLETFISIALLEFDSHQQNREKDKKYRQQRFFHVQEKMKKLLGRTLYGRSVHDVLLIQVCRDVISLERMLEIEPKLDEIVQSAGKEIKDLSEKRRYALQRETKNIEEKLYQITAEEEIFDEVRQSKVFFYTGVRAFGDRMQECYKKRQRYKKPVSFAQAVRIYAPNYRDSVSRIFTSSGMSRQWIIDLCVHLRFNREEIQSVLENAHLVPLSGNSNDEEYYLAERNDLPIGSVLWYQEMEQTYPNAFPRHFAEFCGLELIEKFIIAVLITIFLDTVSKAEDIVPADYLLESFLQYSYGRDACRKVQEFIRDIRQDWTMTQVQEKLSREAAEWLNYLYDPSASLENSNDKTVYRDYQKEFTHYCTFPEAERAGWAGNLALIKLHYLAALLYTVFTGRYYMGRIEEEDLQNIKQQIESQIKDGRTIYHFINQFLLTFANGLPLRRDRDGCYFCVINHKKTSPFDMENVCLDIWESLLVICTK